MDMKGCVFRKDFLPTTSVLCLQPAKRLYTVKYRNLESFHCLNTVSVIYLSLKVEGAAICHTAVMTKAEIK